MKAFFSASTSLLAGSLINTLIYSSGSRIVSFAKPLGALGAGVEAAVLPTLHIAAHQIAMQTWWFLSFFSSPLSLVAQVRVDLIQTVHLKVVLYCIVLCFVVLLKKCVEV